ncbi:MAG: hypothetical protein ACYTG4_04300 [Planctomycetota bacterium]|jgi:hypothetical protein
MTSSSAMKGLVAALALAIPASASAAPQEAAGEAASGRTIETFFKGKVKSVKGRAVTIEYDFSSKGQGADWASTYPFMSPGRSGGFRVETGSIIGNGNAGLRHRAVFDGDVTVEATLTSDSPRNIGVVMLSEDTNTFTLFSIADSVFTLMDKRMPQEHMITTFLPAGKGPGGSTEWRYVKTARKPRVEAGAVTVFARKKGPLNEFRFGSGGNLRGNDVEATVGPRLAASFFVLKGSVVVRDVRISGVLDQKWLKENNISYEAAATPTPEVKPETEKEPRGGTKPEAPVASDGPDWRELVARVRDVNLTENERTAAAETLIEMKERWAARPMIDLLYSEDDTLGRKLGHKVFKALTRKDGGYNPRAPKDYRLKTMQKVWAVWFRLRTALEKESEFAKGAKR